MNQKKKLYTIYEQRNGEAKRALFSSLDYAAAITVLELKAATFASELDQEGLKVISEDKGVRMWAEEQGASEKH